MANNKKLNAANPTNVINERVEKNLKALKLLQENDVNISEAEKKRILNDYSRSADSNLSCSMFSILLIICCSLSVSITSVICFYPCVYL